MNELIVLLKECAPYVEDFDPTKSFADLSIHIDSIDLANFLVSIEEKFNVKIDDAIYAEIFKYSIKELSEVLKI